MEKNTLMTLEKFEKTAEENGMDFGRESVFPPYCNTGVVNTSETGLSSCVDWFSCTFTEENDWTVIPDVIGIESSNFLPMKNGLKGYTKGVVFDNIKILYDGNENMGVHLDMSGEGCRTFENISEISWTDLFRLFVTDYAFSVNITRMDLAVDDFEGYFKIPTLIKYLKNGHVTSRFKIARRLNSIIIKTGEEIGHTLYFGSGQSDIQVRFYEKNIEQIMKGNEIPEGCTVWNRTEIQARNERAKAFMQLLAYETFGAGEIVCGTLKNYIQFRKEVKNDKNKSRWPIAAFWKKFLGDVEKIQLTLKPMSQSVERKYKWIDKSVTKSLALLAVAFPENTQEMFEKFVDEGISKFKKTDVQIIDKFTRKNISYEEFLENMKKESTLGIK